MIPFTLVTSDSTVPATKGDLKNLEQKVDQQFQMVMEYIRTEAEETRRHFGVIAEDIRHDFQGAFHDKLVQHDDRLLRLERHNG